MGEWTPLEDDLYGRRAKTGARKTSPVQPSASNEGRARAPRRAPRDSGHWLLFVARHALSPIRVRPSRWRRRFVDRHKFHTELPNEVRTTGSESGLSVRSAYAANLSSPPQRRYPRQVPERTALYRRYPPQTFSAIVGQDHVTRTLRNAIASGQVAHAFLLAGVRGTGKTSIARLIAKAVNCPNAKDGEPCDRCENCVAIREGHFLDLIEIDAASNRGIDEMRDLRDKVRFAPSQGPYKVYVIDEAHQLTTEAFNALLKTLEEPPPHAIFVLATTESQRIPATIVSRTQRFDLRRIPHKGVVAQLAKIAEQEKLRAEPAALEVIARHAQGSLRDAESMLDMVVAFADGAITLKEVDELLGSSDWEETAALFDALATSDGAKGVTLVGRLVDDGRDLRLFVRRAIEHARALVLTRATGAVPDWASEQVAAKLRAQAQTLSLDQLARIAKRLVQTEQFLRPTRGTPLPLELAILDLVTPNEKASPPPPDAAPRSRGPAASRATPPS